MITRLDIKNIGASGINSDIAPWELPADFITGGINFRVRDGSIESRGTDVLWSNQNRANTGFIMPIQITGSDMMLIASTTGVYSFDGAANGTLKTISPAVNDIRGWTGCMRGGIPVINHPEVGAFYWYPMEHSQPLIPLPFDNVPTAKVWDTNLGITGRVIRSHLNYLFMLNIADQNYGGQVSDAYRWSHPADINSIPPTWDETDQYYLAGFAQLGSDSGQIVDGLSLREQFIIYSDKAINSLSPSGDVFVWNRRQLTTTAGLLCKDALVEVMGVHYFITSGDILMFDGNQVRSIIQGRLRRYLQAKINADYYMNCVAVHSVVTKEVWFCIPTDGSPWPDLAFIYNYQDNSWALREIRPNTTFLAYGSKVEPIDVNIWQTQTQSWASSAIPWISSSVTTFDDTILSTTLDGAIYDSDPEIFSGATGTFIERDFYPIDGHIQYGTILKLYPKITGVGQVRIKVGSRDSTTSGIRWQEPGFLFDPNIDRRVNVRTTGALHAYRIEAVGEGNFRFSGMEIEYAPSGVR